ncbi:hypothetical protein [Streptomyces sp.]|uniref:hypothetical protein n=1 Tax=Streptomyces sp. TaxID=1931 RepID=UPI0028113024|nr:hypothetical protein [Streptomyces sp.]
MKQSAAKKLGVAALGAAFAAAAAGTASAAPELPVGADALGTVTSAVPLGDGLAQLPVGGQGALGQVLDHGAKTLPAAAAQATQHTPLAPVAGLLGSAPIGPVTGLLGGLQPGSLPIG